MTVVRCGSGTLEAFERPATDDAAEAEARPFAQLAVRAVRGAFKNITSTRFILAGVTGLCLSGASCFSSPGPRLRPMPVYSGGPRLASSKESLSGQRDGVEHAGAASANAVTTAEEPLLDTWSLAAREDGAACRDALKSAGFEFRSYPDKTQPDKSGCGIPHAVVVFRGPTRIAYDPPITVDCSLARALESVERIVQEEAETHLHSRIARIGNLGGYACRKRNYRKDASLSAHAFGSAVDVASFHPVKGTAAIIVRDYAEPKRPSPGQEDRRNFLHAVFRRLRRDADLTYAVGPDFNAIHHNHFHLDRGGWHFWYHR